MILCECQRPKSFDVGVRSTLPVEGIQLLLGNDLAGDKVKTNPIMTDRPQLSNVIDPIEEEIPDLYPSCAVTRAMAKKAIDQETPIVGKPDFEYNLADTFLRQDLGEDFYSSPGSSSQKQFSTSGVQGTLSPEQDLSHDHVVHSTHSPDTCITGPFRGTSSCKDFNESKIHFDGSKSPYSNVKNSAGISEPSGFSGGDESLSQLSNVLTKDLQHGPIDHSVSPCQGPLTNDSDSSLDSHTTLTET